METSCGVVLVNFDTILLLQYPQGHWDLPKGHVEDSDEDKDEPAPPPPKKVVKKVVKKKVAASE